MIRSKMMMLAFGALSLTGVSAMAATRTTHHQPKQTVVAQAEGGDAAKPVEAGKKAKKSKATKARKAKGTKAAGDEATPSPAPEAK